MSIFRAYDIRGTYPDQIDEHMCYQIGIAYSNLMGDKIKEVIIGFDIRKSSPDLARSIIQGILHTGKNVVDIGLVPTPVLYFGIAHYKRKAGVMITASHLPKQYNGIKLQKEKSVGLTGETGIYKIEKMVKNESLKLSQKKGKIKKINIINNYIKYHVKKTKLKKKLTIVIDSANGCCGTVAPKIFRKLGCKVIELYSKPDGTFPNHSPDPHEHVKHHTMDKLAKTVKAKKADLGIAYDGDGDRSGYVDNKGYILSEDQYIMIFARQVLKDAKARKKNIVLDIRASNTVIKDIKENGGIPLLSKAGHSYIEAMDIRKKALFGAEESGHLFFPLYYYQYDDAIFASLKMAEIVSNLETDFATYVKQLPKGFASPEIRKKYDDNKKFQLIKDLKKDIKKKRWKMIKIDGVRIEFSKKKNNCEGWALVRASNTSPAITMRFEGNTKKDLVKIKKTVKCLLRKYRVSV